VRNTILATIALVTWMPLTGRSVSATVGHAFLIATLNLWLISIGLVVSASRLRRTAVEDWRELYSARWKYLRQGTCQITAPADDEKHGSDELELLGRVSGDRGRAA